MGKTFRAYNLDQRLLLPPDMRQWLPEGHVAPFLLDVVEQLDLSEILERYESGDGRGQPPYPPVMMVTLLLYAYWTGKPKEARGFRRFSFRGLAKVAAEWNLIALTHNLLKLWRAQPRLLAA
jgi:transposase